MYFCARANGGYWSIFLTVLIVTECSDKPLHYISSFILHPLTSRHISPVSAAFPQQKPSRWTARPQRAALPTTVRCWPLTWRTSRPSGTNKFFRIVSGGRLVLPRVSQNQWWDQRFNHPGYRVVVCKILTLGKTKPQMVLPKLVEVLEMSVWWLGITL